MGLFHKKSTWEKLIEPVSNGVPKTVAKSGLTALGTLGTFVAVSVASAAVSAARQRKESG